MLRDLVVREQDFIRPCNVHFVPVDANGLSAFRHLLFLPNHIPWFLVEAQSKKSRLAQFSIAGPLAEGNLRHQLWTRPVHASTWQTIAGKRSGPRLELAPFGVQASPGS